MDRAFDPDQLATPHIREWPLPSRQLRPDRVALQASHPQRYPGLFISGIITGCPKVRTMQTIRELEQTPRRSYTGSVGYINRNGSFDFNILIRSVLLRGRELNFGAGIVVDSDAAREHDETRAKARGLVRALDVA